MHSGFLFQHFGLHEIDDSSTGEMKFVKAVRKIHQSYKSRSHIDFKLATEVVSFLAATPRLVNLLGKLAIYLGSLRAIECNVLISFVGNQSCNVCGKEGGRCCPRNSDFLKVPYYSARHRQSSGVEQSSSEIVKACMEPSPL
ncbi:uncharacterized protein LOC143877601 [Tasmannia lanceolata]|uniref:uncharacterized protein LOC143877601 n=1 Tax=Tasmannia lanceolata TaxID=3420 RepID=UPI0040638294